MTRSWIVVPLVLASVACAELGLSSDMDDESTLPSAEELRAQLTRDMRVEGRLPLVEAFTVVGAPPEPQLQPHLQAVIVARNEGTEPIRANTALFPWWLRAYATPERDQGPIWRGEEHYAGGPDILEVFHVPPGDSARFQIPLVPVSGILKDHPPGRYYFTVELEFFEPKLRTGEFFLGAADLIDSTK